VRELQLRAQQPGALLIGPVRAKQGVSVVSTDPILVTVDSAADRSTVALNPLARALLETAAPPISRRTDRVALTMLVPSDSVFTGQQVDFDRRRLDPARAPRADASRAALDAGDAGGRLGVSGGHVVRRRAVAPGGGRWLDLFIAHQVVFPLAPGRLIIPPASVEYALPVTFSFFSREERYTLRSDSIAITVLPLPSPHITNVVGERVSLDLQVDPATTRVGEPVEASVTVSGVGNVALWPEPPLSWPTGFRVYPAQTEVRIAPEAGRIAGSKTFQFLAVPDSSGNFVLPEVRYGYFGSGRRSLHHGNDRAASARRRSGRRAARCACAATLLPSRGEVGVDRLTRQVGWEGWLAVLLVPPLIAELARRRWRRDTPRPRARPKEVGS